MISVTYYYSACVGIKTEDVSILCDPWFTDGVYDGSWYQYPKLENPLEKIGRYDLIYVSHIHPDHYDPLFLRTYLNRYPNAKVIIAAFEKNYLSLRMKADGIAHSLVHKEERNRTQLEIFPNASRSYDVDSALAVRHSGHSVVNMNDNLFNEEQVSRIREFCGDPVIALLGYTGAGPYPQTYYADEKKLSELSQQKKESFFERYRHMRDALNPKVSIPFAGKYILGGHLHHLNRYRGVADAVEIAALDPRAVVLADGGEATIDTESLKPTAVRRDAYDTERMDSYAHSLADKPMVYDVYFGSLPVPTIPLRRLLPKAYQRASEHSVCAEDYYLCFKLPSEWFFANAKKQSGQCGFAESVTHLVPRSEIQIAPRYLFGLLAGIFHWNNASIGSQYMTTRVPDQFSRDAQAFLNFFHL